MGTCKYCGQSAGIFSRSHKQCEEKHARGVEGITQLMRRYFNGSVSASDFGMKITRNRVPYYLSEDDIVSSAEIVIKEYSSSLRRPYRAEILTRIKGFLANVGVPYSSINKNGVLDTLSMKLFQGYVVDFFAKDLSLSQISICTDSVTSVLPLSSIKKDEAYFNVLAKAADNFMRDGYLSDREQQQIESYVSALGISLNAIPTQYRTESLARIGQAIVLNDLQRGKLPQRPLTVPVMLSKGEVPLWTYDGVTMFQEKINREYVGGSRGMSYRICKGLTYRTGSFKGHPVERSHMETIGHGQLVITNKNLFFHCSTSSVKIPYSKLVGVTPYSDGLEVHKEEAKPKRTVFQGFDAWFVMNVLNQVSV